MIIGYNEGKKCYVLEFKNRMVKLTKVEFEA